MLVKPNEPDFDFELSDIKRLTDVIHTKYGFDFENYALSSFKRRILSVIKKYHIKSFDALLQKVIHDAHFFEQFVMDITVNTTEMFRDPSFFRVLRTQILPELAQKPSFNVWHAACSTGEEVLSLAILMKELGILQQAKVYATDINQNVLRKASSAKISIRSLALAESNYLATQPTKRLSDYYQIVDTEVQFNPELIKQVKFKHHDLAVDSHFYKFDLILCRNVLIYFNQVLQNRVFELLHHSLFPSGLLALGSKESMIWCKIADKYEVINDIEKIYRKVRP
ncbi:MAG: protein-glutamate O-methyltransferase CheR [Bacteroidia bacterium]|nr:protein-glutamate O-methyltransferase CheR [Bacteroidia bacterium]